MYIHVHTEKRKRKRAEAVIRELEKVATRTFASNNSSNGSGDNRSEQRQRQQQQQQGTIPSWEERRGGVEKRFTRNTASSKIHTEPLAVSPAYEEDPESAVLRQSGRGRNSEDETETDSDEDRREDGAEGWSELAEGGRTGSRVCSNCLGPLAAERLKYRKQERAARASSTDVWSMLDAYVRRRSGVARAKCHVKAIEVMREV